MQLKYAFWCTPRRVLVGLTSSIVYQFIKWNCLGMQGKTVTKVLLKVNILHIHRFTRMPKNWQNSFQALTISFILKKKRTKQCPMHMSPPKVPVKLLLFVNACAIYEWDAIIFLSKSWEFCLLHKLSPKRVWSPLDSFHSRYLVVKLSAIKRLIFLLKSFKIGLLVISYGGIFLSAASFLMNAQKGNTTK